MVVAMYDVRWSMGLRPFYDVRCTMVATMCDVRCTMALTMCDVRWSMGLWTFYDVRCAVHYGRFFFNTSGKTAKNDEKRKQIFEKMISKCTMFLVFSTQTLLVTDRFLGVELISDIEITF